MRLAMRKFTSPNEAGGKPGLGTTQKPANQADYADYPIEWFSA
jgi:hypothetical protein